MENGPRRQAVPTSMAACMQCGSPIQSLSCTRGAFIIGEHHSKSRRMPICPRERSTDTLLRSMTLPEKNAGGQSLQCPCLGGSVPGSIATTISRRDYARSYIRFKTSWTAVQLHSLDALLAADAAGEDSATARQHILGAGTLGQSKDGTESRTSQQRK
jgi:hypothetical protein